MLRENLPNKFLIIAECLRREISLQKVIDNSLYDAWFVREIEGLVQTEVLLRKKKFNLDLYLYSKSQGFSDEKILSLSKITKQFLKKFKNKHKLSTRFRNIDTCAGEFRSLTPYMYSSWDSLGFHESHEKETMVSNKKKVIIIGGGPNRIGQGIEFDYCCVHSSFAVRELGLESIMINCNPETVSTDFDISDRLYFEPLDVESVLEICKAENKKGKLLGVIVQLGGQTPLKLSEFLVNEKIKILGTSFKSIDLSEDRDRFKQLMKRLNVNQPLSDIVFNLKDAKQAIKKINFPVVIRPSYVLGGRAMRVVNTGKELDKYFSQDFIENGKSILVDEFLLNAKEIDVDAISDGNDILIAGILEHIEEAGVHSGDSACSIPPQSLSQIIIKEIEKITKKIALSLDIVGFINIQFAIKDCKVFVIEVNPRASRTIPFISKAIGIPLANIATKLMLGRKLKDFELHHSQNGYVCVKESVFPFDKFPGEDIILGPEMKSTGEVMGIERNFPNAFLKSQIAAGNNLPKKGSVFISVRDADKENIILMSQLLERLNFKILATKGTGIFLKKYLINVSIVKKVNEGKPHVVDLIENGSINLIINTTSGEKSISDSLSIRRSAIINKIPYFTTISAAQVAVSGLNIISKKELKVKSLQEFYKQ